MSRKRPHEKVIRTTISLAPTLYDTAKADMQREGFSGFSDFIQSLIRQHAGLGTTQPH